jgi:hypothetical protein
MDPQVREEMRGSLVLSVLAQLSSDRDPETRASAVQSLATLSRAITDADKFPQMLRLALEFVSRDGCIVAPPLVNFLFCVFFFVVVCLSNISHRDNVFFFFSPNNAALRLPRASPMLWSTARYPREHLARPTLAG